MKKLLIAGAALMGVMGMAGAANAAPYGDRYGYAPAAYGADFNRQQANIDHRIDMGLRNGSLTRGEAFRLRAQLRDTERLEARYARGGFSRWEVADLDRRLDALSRQVRFERHDRQDRRWRS